ncbi:MAG: zinc-binding dehydrogenase, partial [Betaproteobacteria bacterium]|nr:zinc-binding dehydrogenase [Betaproteobacteria bacterium]
REAGLFDCIVDSAGGPGFPKLCDLARPGGRIVSFGATAGNPPELPLRKIFGRQLCLLGTTMGSPGEFASMVGLVRDAGIRPVIDKVFPLAEANEALARMEAGGQFGKIVLRIGYSDEQ